MTEKKGPAREKDEDAVQFSTPVGILPARNWPYPRIHTLNRAGSLEVIDGIAEVRRRGGSTETAADAA